MLLSDDDAPSSLELTVGADGDAVDWYDPPPPWNSPSGGGRDVRLPFGIKRYLLRRGGIKIPPAATRSHCGERLLVLSLRMIRQVRRSKDG